MELNRRPRELSYSSRLIGQPKCARFLFAVLITFGLVTDLSLLGIAGDTPPDLDNCCPAKVVKTGTQENNRVIDNAGDHVPATVSKDSKGNVIRIVVSPGTSSEEDFCFNWAGALTRHYVEGNKECRAFSGNTFIGWKINGEVRQSNHPDWKKAESDSVDRSHKLYYKALKADRVKA